MSIVLVDLPAPPGGGASVAGVAMTWTGGDGSSWDLTRRSDGVWLMPGFRGLRMPPLDRFVSDSPSVDGSRWRGNRVLEREVFWPGAPRSVGGDAAVGGDADAGVPVDAGV